MTLSPRLEDSLARLNTAVRRLQAAAERRAEADAERADREQEFALLQGDRARLAVELDAAIAAKNDLLASNQEVFHRLDRAGRTVQRVVQRLAGSALSGEAH